MMFRIPDPELFDVNPVLFLPLEDYRHSGSERLPGHLFVAGHTRFAFGTMLGKHLSVGGIDDEIGFGINFGDWQHRFLHTCSRFGVFIGSTERNLSMEEEAEVICPYCGQGFELVIDTSVGRQRFTTDCEICCRPFEVTVQCEAGEILSLDVRGE